MNQEEFVASIVLVKQDLALPTAASRAAELIVADIACHEDKLGGAGRHASHASGSQMTMRRRRDS
jgi:hypothetical protein